MLHWHPLNGEGIQDFQVLNLAVLTSCFILLPAYVPTNFNILQILCAGLHYYTAIDGTTKKDNDNIIQYVPRTMDHVLLGNLKPNFHYCCTVVEEDKTKQFSSLERMSEPQFFSTHYGGKHKSKDINLYDGWVLQEKEATQLLGTL